MKKKSNRRKNLKHVAGLMILFLLLTLLPSQSVYAATITVNSPADELNDGNGECTLREAITNANDNNNTYSDCASVGNYGNDTINLPAGTYTLALGSGNEDANQEGDLDITDSDGLTIIGADARTTIIEAGDSAANGIDRVFHIGGGATVTIEQVTIQHGNFSFGGGIWNQGTLTLNDTTVTDNTSTGDGGAIRNQSSLILNRSTISHNTGRRGAGIWMHNATLEMSNSTISTNMSTEIEGGGGMYIDNGSAALIVNISNSTIANNSATSGDGGGIRGRNGTVNIKNTIIADNTASTNPDCAGFLTSNGYNLIGNNSCGMTPATGDITDQAALLNGLANNGGSTDTHELQDTSPAKDGGESGSCTTISGSPVLEDQRGGARPQNSDCDIGAYEVGALAVDLASFTATNEGYHLRVEWATVWETNNQGFNLYRHTSEELPESAEPLNEELIPAEAPGGGSGSYEYEDHDAVFGTTYYYWLGDIDLGDNETLHGPISISYDSIPTSVSMSRFESHKPSSPSWLVMLTVLGMTIGVIGIVFRIPYSVFRR